MSHILQGACFRSMKKILDSRYEDSDLWINFLSKMIIDMEVKHKKTGYILKAFRSSKDEIRCQICLPERDVIMKKDCKNWSNHFNGKFHRQKLKDFIFI